MVRQAVIVRRFLKDCEACRRRQGDSAPIQAMRLCMSPDDYDDLLDEAEPLSLGDKDAGADEHPAGVAQALTEEDGPGEEEDDDSEDQEEEDQVHDGPMVKGSNANVLGPRTKDETATILAGIRMREDPAGRVKSNLVATRYVREWEQALDWCARALPSSKWIVSRFLAGINNNSIMRSLEIVGHKDIKKLMVALRQHWKECVEANTTLNPQGSGEAVVSVANTHSFKRCLKATISLLISRCPKSSRDLLIEVLLMPLKNRDTIHFEDGNVLAHHSKAFSHSRTYRVAPKFDLNRPIITFFCFRTKSVSSEIRLKHFALRRAYLPSCLAETQRKCLLLAVLAYWLNAVIMRA
jgi:hypothetical protein